MTVLQLTEAANQPSPPAARFRCACGAWFAPQLVVVERDRPPHHACARCSEFDGGEFSEAAVSN